MITLKTAWHGENPPPHSVLGIGFWEPETARLFGENLACRVSTRISTTVGGVRATEVLHALREFFIGRLVQPLQKKPLGYLWPRGTPVALFNVAQRNEACASRPTREIAVIRFREPKLRYNFVAQWYQPSPASPLHHLSLNPDIPLFVLYVWPLYKIRRNAGRNPGHFGNQMRRRFLFATCDRDRVTDASCPSS
jgi:hypothetical protein